MKKTLLYTFIWFALSVGCETIVEIDIPVEPTRLVINSILSDKEFISANISESKHILDGSDVYKTVQGATVEIYEDGNLLTTLIDSLEGNYISNNFKPLRGKLYKISVSKGGFEIATANVLMPLDTATILSVKMDTITEPQQGYTSTYLRFSVAVQDNELINNFYSIAVYQEGYHYQYDYNVAPPVLIDSVYYYHKLQIQTRDPSLEDFQSYGQDILFNDELFNGSTYHINVLTWLPSEDSNTTYYIELANTSESYYRYKLSSELQYFAGDNPFAQPVTVYNNIENGFGVFGAYNTAVVKVE